MIDLTMSRAVPREGGEMSEHMEEIMSGNRVNAPDPNHPGMRIVGWRVTEQVAGLSKALFVIEEIEKAARSHAALRAALEGLANEVSGLSAFEIDVRGVIGNTNWACIMERVAAARRALTEA